MTGFDVTGELLCGLGLGLRNDPRHGSILFGRDNEILFIRSQNSGGRFGAASALSLDGSRIREVEKLENS